MACTLPRRDLTDLDLVAIRDGLVEAMGESTSNSCSSLPLMAQSGEAVFTHAGVGKGDGDALGNHHADALGRHIVGSGTGRRPENWSCMAIMTEHGPRGPAGSDLAWIRVPIHSGRLTAVASGRRRGVRLG